MDDELGEHIRNCRRCRELFEQQKRVVDLLDYYKAEEPPAGLPSRIMKRVYHEGLTKGSRNGTNFWVSITAAGALILGIASGIGIGKVLLAKDSNGSLKMDEYEKIVEECVDAFSYMPSEFPATIIASYKMNISGEREGEK